MKFLGLKPPSSALYLILGTLAMIVAIPAVEYIGVLNQKIHFGNEAQKWMKGMEEDAAKQIKFMLSKHTISELMANLLFIAAFAGIGEELFFRGVLQRMFIRMFKDPWAGIVLTAAIFSAFHFQFFGFFPRLALGILLGAMYWYSGSLWISIIVHFVYDGLMIVVIYLDPAKIENPDETIMNPSSLVYSSIVSILLVIILVRYMKKKSVTSYKDVYSEDQPKDLFTF
jgi:membrane protease YdiL (CAAX protease family)